jgi:transposase
MKAERFEQWMEHKLLQEVPAGSTVIMDNASIHRKEALQKTREGKVNLLFLPPYSPDLNPIEKDWANMKRELRDTAPMYELLQTSIYIYWK